MLYGRFPHDAEPAAAHPAARRSPSRARRPREPRARPCRPRSPRAPGSGRGRSRSPRARRQRSSRGSGQRAAAGADLDDALPGPGVDCRDDAPQDAGIVQEMLPEPLARAVQGGGQPGPRRAASRIDSNRLPGSARPVPARSSAVPWSTDTRRNGRPSVTLTALPKPACLITGRPWSWYIASTTSARPRESGVKAVSAGTGPVTASPCARKRRDRGGDHLDLLAPEVPALAGVRVEAADEDARRGDAGNLPAARDRARASCARAIRA